MFALFQDAFSALVESNYANVIIQPTLLFHVYGLESLLSGVEVTLIWEVQSPKPFYRCDIWNAERVVAYSYAKSLHVFVDLSRTRLVIHTVALDRQNKLRGQTTFQRRLSN